MAMHLGPSDGDDELLTSINTTPLVDVMLVLLIIFLITIPVVTTSVKVDLPREVQHHAKPSPTTSFFRSTHEAKRFCLTHPCATKQRWSSNFKLWQTKNRSPKCKYGAMHKQTMKQSDAFYLRHKAQGLRKCASSRTHKRNKPCFRNHPCFKPSKNPR